MSNEHEEKQETPVDWVKRKALRAESEAALREKTGKHGAEWIPSYEGDECVNLSRFSYPAEQSRQAHEALAKWEKASRAFGAELFRAGYEYAIEHANRPGEHRCSCFSCKDRLRRIAEEGWAWYQGRHYPRALADAQKD